MSAPFDDLDPTADSPEDRVNALRGYKAYVSVSIIPIKYTCTTHLLTPNDSTLNNPRVSNEAKENARNVIDNQLGGDQPREDLYALRNPTKEPTRVQGGLKA
jgi:hypothetical protein